MIVGASPAVLALFVVFFVPESERWKHAAKKGGQQPDRRNLQPGLRRNTLLAIGLPPSR